MAVLELLENDSSDKAVTEIGKAFLAAHLAREIGMEQKGMEPEEVFISTLFRHLSRIALAIGNPGLLSEIEKLEAGHDRQDRLKARRILRSVGYQLSELWNLPKTLSGYIEGCNPNPSGQFAPHKAIARDVSTFVSLWQKGGEQENFQVARKRLLKNYDIGADGLETKLNKAIKDTKRTQPEFKRVVEKKSGGLKVKKQAPSRGLGDETPSEIKSHLEKEILFTGLIQNLMGMVNDMDAGLEQVYLLAIEILRRIIDIANIIFCKISPERELFSASFGMGARPVF